MLRTFSGALAVWLGVFDGLAARMGLAGLNWGGTWLGPTVAVAAALRLQPGPGALVTALPAAALVHVGMATLRRRQLNPLLRLNPDRYTDRQIARVTLPGAFGPVPALHVVPTGGAYAAICIAHGSGGDKRFYAWRLADELNARGMAALFVDLDGHGESPRPQDFPAIIESVSGPARWLRARYRRVGLLGMSLGGAVTARAAADGAPCDALAIWEAPPRLRLSAREYRRVQIAEAMRILRPTLLHLFRDSSPYHIVRAWQTSGIRARIGTWDLFDALDLLGSLERIKARDNRPPLFLVYAGRDAVLHPGADAEVRAATADWASFHLVPGASHVSLPIELETITLTADWLRERLER